jgi:hypothetical protein
MRRTLALLSFLTPLAHAQVTGSNQQPAFNPGGLNTASKASSLDTGSRSMDLLLDMAAAASAPEGAANSKKNEDPRKTESFAKDSRAKLLEELRKPTIDGKDRASGRGSEPNDKPALPASLTNAGAAAAIASQMSAGNDAGRAVQQNDEIEISIQRRNEIVARQQESAAPMQGIVDTKPFLRTIVAYLRENRGVVIAVGITALLLGWLLSYSVSRAGTASSRPTGGDGRHPPSKASGVAPSAARVSGERSTPKAAAGATTKNLARRPQRHSPR